jgi:glycosyltransferase involved in cell wall biosynthesis
MEEGQGIPEGLGDRDNLSVRMLPGPFLRSEKALSDLTRRGVDLFISPYPKLPLFGCFCRAVHVVHDVLDLTHKPYRRRVRTYFDRYRLQSALRDAAMTWYDSEWSLQETVQLSGFAGRKPRVRYPGIDGKFTPARTAENEAVLRAHDLAPGYVAVIGNGLPHKNLGVLLRIASQIRRTFLFIGVPEENRNHWENQYDTGAIRWVRGVKDRDLPHLLRGAFCLAQPSLAEGYGYPPLEAMACGIPAVVSRIPVLMETTGGMALTADPASPGEWKQAFERLEDPGVYRHLAEEGLRWVTPLRGPQAWEPYIDDVAEVLTSGG